MAATLFTAGGVIGLAVVIEWLQTGLVLRIPSAILSTLFILTAIQLASVGMSMDMMKNNMMRLNYEIRKANKKKPIKS